MGQRLTLRYDREGDILYLDRCAPYSEQESVELGDEVTARLHPRTEETESLEILFFSTHLSQIEVTELRPANDQRDLGTGAKMRPICCDDSARRDEEFK